MRRLSHSEYRENTKSVLRTAGLRYSMSDFICFPKARSGILFYWSLNYTCRPKYKIQSKSQ